jgi:MoaA/NifB/PqqE/SkfB family radical SAM enzyme
MLKLEEVIWEVTPECDKGCKYCGSKDVLKNKCLPAGQLIKIASKIANYQVKEVNLSGGEPGVLACNDPKVFNDIMQILTESGAKVKIVTNGKILDADIDFEKISVIGFSFNTKRNVETLQTPEDSKRHTMITNFGTHNIWDFDILYTLARHFGCWQVQLTMGEYMLAPEGIKYLRNKVADLPQESGFVVVEADNLQPCHQCTAGLRSCGVTYTGDVIACLSERSYGPCKSYGNLLETSMQEIWENGFKDCRFSCDRKCCRDYIIYPAVDKLNKIEAVTTTCPPNANPIYIELPEENFPSQPIVTLYAVFTPQVMAYAVAEPSSTTIAINTPMRKPVYDVTKPGYPYAPSKKQQRRNDDGWNDGGTRMVYGVFGGW